MANKVVKYTFGGANQDLSKSKHPVQFYYEGQHIRLLATDSQSSGSITNEKGNELVITLPNVNIIGTVTPAIIANNDSIQIEINKVKTINVLSNDVFLYPVTVTMITPPTNGTYVINANKTITYTNTSGVIGIDSFTYQIDDGSTTDTATVSISISETVVILPPDEELEPGETNNYDGTYYRYVLAPCDRTQSFIRIKSIKMITDNDIYTVLGSGGVGKEGAIAYKDTDLSITKWNIGPKYGPNCPPN